VYYGDPGIRSENDTQLYSSHTVFSFFFFFCKWSHACLIMYFAFVRYLRKNGNAMQQCSSSL